MGKEDLLLSLFWSAAMLNKLSNGVVSVANQTMNNVAAEVREMSDTTAEVVKTTCFFDGTWQKQGFLSLISVVSCISSVNYKVLDVENLTT